MIRTPSTGRRIHKRRAACRDAAHERRDCITTGSGSLTAFVELPVQQLGHGWRMLATLHIMVHDISTGRVSDGALCVGYAKMAQGLKPHLRITNPFAAEAGTS